MKGWTPQREKIWFDLPDWWGHRSPTEKVWDIDQLAEMQHYALQRGRHFLRQLIFLKQQQEDWSRKTINGDWNCSSQCTNHHVPFEIAEKDRPSQMIDYFTTECKIFYKFPDEREMHNVSKALGESCDTFRRAKSKIQYINTNGVDCPVYKELWLGLSQ